MIPEIYRLYCDGRGEAGAQVSAQARVLNDVIAILEADRVIIKTYNNVVI